MRRPRFRLRLLSVLVLVPALAACDAGSLDDAGSNAARADAPDAAARSVNAQLAAVRALTAPYHDFAAGEEAGWAVDISEGCVPEMGHHYGNLEYVLDGGFVTPLEPEVLLYEPQRNGRKRLVGVEYVVPVYSEEDGPPPYPQPAEAPPVLFGEDFHWNPFLGLWMLHVWIWKNNPDGMFTDFNPTVSCEYAQS